MIILESPALPEQIKDASQDLDGYIKITIDIARRIAVIGEKLHVDAEQLLLEKGSHQDNIWGGGYDLESKQIDYNSIINLRPAMQNLSEEIILPEVRKTFEELTKYFLTIL